MTLATAASAAVGTRPPLEIAKGTAAVCLWRWGRGPDTKAMRTCMNRLRIPLCHRLLDGFFFLMRFCAGHAADNGIIINTIRYYYTFGFRTITDVCVAAVVTTVSTNRCSSIVPPSCIQDDDFTINYTRNLCVEIEILYIKFIYWGRNDGRGGGLWFIFCVSTMLLPDVGR